MEIGSLQKTDTVNGFLKKVSFKEYQNGCNDDGSEGTSYWRSKNLRIWEWMKS